MTIHLGNGILYIFGDFYNHGFVCVKGKEIMIYDRISEDEFKASIINHSEYAYGFRMSNDEVSIILNELLEELGQDTIMKADDKICLDLLERQWLEVVYDKAIPDKVKNDRKFKNEINRMKLKHGPMEKISFLKAYDYEQ